MKKGQIPTPRGKKNAEGVEQGFMVSVDGVKYGPFLEKHKLQYASLEHMKGVVFTTVWRSDGWILPPPRVKPKKRDRSTPLLDGTGFVPVSKG